MITVHHLDFSRSHRVLWLLEELGLPYEIKLYQRDKHTLLAPAALRAVHPLGKSPVITDGEKTIAESGAILEYLVETYGEGRLVPVAGTAERDRYRYWMHYAEGSAMPLLVMKLIFTRLPTQAPALIRSLLRVVMGRAMESFLDPQLATHAAFWEAELGKSAWFAGDAFTAADIQMSFPVEAGTSRMGPGSGGARLSAYLERLRARPAYQRALEKGGPVILPLG